MIANHSQTSNSASVRFTRTEAPVKPEWQNRDKQVNQHLVDSSGAVQVALRTPPPKR